MNSRPPSRDDVPPPNDGPPPSDARLTAVGAATGLILAVPAALANVALVDREPRPVAMINMTLLGFALGFTLAGFTTAREVRSDRRRRGIHAALGTFAAVEVIGILGRLDRGSGISVGSIVVLLALALLFGSVGARLGERRPSRNQDVAPD